MSIRAQVSEVDAFDPLEPSNVKNPFPFFARLRAEEPAFWNERYSFWMVSRYRDIKPILQQPQMFSSVTTDSFVKWRDKIPQSSQASFDTGIRFFYGHMQASDPPVHTIHRQAVMKEFMPLITGVVRRSLEERVNHLLDEMEQAGTCDFVKDFAYPLPSTVIFDLLGVPEEDRQVIREASDSIVRLPNAVFTIDSEAIDQIAEKMDKAEAVLMRMVQSRRREPKEDLISSLVRVDGGMEQLSDKDIITTCVFLLTAGHETTANLLGGSMRYLLQDRRQWEQLVATPEILPGAIEELLRFVSPVLWLSRIPQDDFELHGKLVRKGTQLMLGIGSANHDPAEFSDPELLDVTRKNVYSLSLGHGIHTCLGAALAKMETLIALGQLLKRFPRIQLVGDQFEYHQVYFLRALKSLPVAVNP